MKIKHVFLLLVVVAFTLSSCKNNKKQDEKAQEEATEEVTTDDHAKTDDVTYESELTALNNEVVGSETTGKAIFIVSDGQMKVSIDVKNAPANMQHWQHFHGFVNGDEATCATADNDGNEDGIIDVTETEDASGTTMVPFNKIPTDMDLGADNYPEADEDGNYHYEATLKVDDLEKVFGEAFEGQDINLDSRVLYIHGVPDDADLPESVQSIADIPTTTTLPIACGKIVKK